MEIDGKTIDIYPSKTPDAPLVMLNSFMRSDGEVCEKCEELACGDFTLAEISGLNWNDELSPWSCLPRHERDETYGGKADAYLDLLLRQILPAVRAELPDKPSCILLAGYSLAGLFALYAATKCDVFQAIASCSGSLWFPDFKEYILGQDTANFPKHLYFSLGDREARTRHPLFRAVEDNTRAIVAFLSANGVNTVLEMNQGNHFQEGMLRTAKGIKWMTEQIRKR
ncbi:MAG: alpha/beta hydrolase [Ruminococcus sp.]|nr:alpha/beta hydrolase [Ruminococcus sp.]